MSIESRAAKLFQMSDDVWERHANPWSVWTRYPCLPLLAIAIWSRVWIGWVSLLPIALICVWIWINPRVFGKPKSTRNWASKAVLGERALLAHHLLSHLFQELIKKAYSSTAPSKTSMR